MTMKAKWNIALIQPLYPDFKHAYPMDTIHFIFREIQHLNKDTDLLVLPEYSNAPGINDYETMISFIENDNRDYLAKLCGIAQEKKMHIAANMVRKRNGNYYNTTVWIDRNGAVVREYEKTHLTDSERKDLRLQSGEIVQIYEIENTRISFATCFELYFPEYFEKLASLNPDLIVVPTYQRSEAAKRLEAQARVRAMDCGAHLLRSSYSMGEQSQFGGMSMLVDPKGDVVCNAGSATGTFYAQCDLTEKWLRPRSHGQEQTNARIIIEENRRPHLYRTTNRLEENVAMKYPSVIAHRGYSELLPENTLPAFGSAIAIGAGEVELDIRCSKDGELIIIHDETINRTTDGSGRVSDYTWEELITFDAGKWHSPGWSGVRLTRFEDVLKQYGGQAIFNVHVYEAGEDGYSIKKIKQLAEQYKVTDSIYISGNKAILEYALKYAPEIERCCLEGQQSWDLVDYAIQYKCSRLQFFKSFCHKEMIDKAHQAGIRCNLFFADTAEDAEHYYNLGIDAILTNSPLQVIEAARKLGQ